MQRQAREDVHEYFECPNSCGEYLEVEPHKVAYKITKNNEGKFVAEVRPGKCPSCGCVVCPRCKQKVVLNEGKHHFCSEGMGAREIQDAVDAEKESASMALIAKGHNGLAFIHLFLSLTHACTSTPTHARNQSYFHVRSWKELPSV